MIYIRKSAWLVVICTALCLAFSSGEAQSAGTAPPTTEKKPKPPESGLSKAISPPKLKKIGSPGDKTPAGPTRTSLFGIVTDSAGKPISDALIEISTKEPYSTIALRTSSEGEFSTDSLVIGDTYTLAAMRFGYYATESKPFTVNASSSTKLFTVVLRHRRTVTLPAGSHTKLARADSVVASTTRAD